MNVYVYRVANYLGALLCVALVLFPTWPPNPAIRYRFWMFASFSFLILLRARDTTERALISEFAYLLGVSAALLAYRVFGVHGTLWTPLTFGVIALAVASGWCLIQARRRPPEQPEIREVLRQRIHEIRTLPRSAVLFGVGTALIAAASIGWFGGALWWICRYAAFLPVWWFVIACLTAGLGVYLKHANPAR